MRTKTFPTLLCALAIAVPLAQAQPWTSFENNTRYLALGDSLSAGYGAIPATQGFVYQVYQSGVIDNLTNTLFASIAIPNATSSSVLLYQVPQVPLFFANTGQSYKKVITLTVGGNDLLAGPGAIAPYAANLTAILGTLIAQSPDVKIYVGNLYDPRLGPLVSALVDAMNQAIAAVVAGFPAHAVLVDLHAAFDGRSGLLLGERQGASFDQVHPTNAGYRAIAQAFEDAIRAN
jgi:lysophospholipase L1-like esterase